MTYHPAKSGSDCERRNSCGGGGAWWGEALWRCVVPTGLRVFCGHRLSTRRRVIFNCLSRPETKADGDRAATYAAMKLGRDVNSRRRERFFAKNFIGHPAGHCTYTRRGARRRLWSALWAARNWRPECRDFARDAWNSSAVRADSRDIGREIPLDQPSRQQSIAALVYPHIKELRDFFSQVCGEIQSRLLVRLQRRFRRTQEKFPIHFLLVRLAHGDPP